MGPQSSSLAARAHAELSTFRDRLFFLRTWLTDRETRALLSLDLFDPIFYLANNADVKVAKVDPLIHYLRWGRKEGRKPSAEVDRSALFEYLRQNGNTRYRVGAFAARIGLKRPRLKQLLAEPALGLAFLTAERNPDFWPCYELIEESDLFDGEYYRHLVPDAAKWILSPTI